jgi:dihydrodipicolinate synthase/N-acetylneuraminate lyase
MDITPLKSNVLSIESRITPETIYLSHYLESDQLHALILLGTTGKSIFLSREDAARIRDFLNKEYPA